MNDRKARRKEKAENRLKKHSEFFNDNGLTEVKPTCFIDGEMYSYHDGKWNKTQAR